MNPTSPSVPSTLTGRRGFLARLSAATAAFAAGAPAAHAAGVLEPNDAPEPWLRALKGKHRQLFHSHDKMDATVLWQARTFIDLYREAYGVAADQVNVVVAAHGQTGGMLLNDMLWEKYELGKMYKVNMLDPNPPAAPTPAATTPTPSTDAGAAAATPAQPARPPRIPATRNVYHAPRAGDPVDARTSVDALRQLGTTFLLCNNALKQFANYTARKSGLTVEAAHRELTENLVPGAVLVPTMLIAINRAQENGCSYLYSG